ncbi:MAG: hypothetical protein H6Q90_4559 [Deltaproteobacteria bacterium]|nr:hypothetical protein [Deltaproteobacteria bacterium]
MGPQRVLQAACFVAVALGLGITEAAPARTHERVAIIDLGPSRIEGPSDPAVRRQLNAALVAAGLDVVIGDGVDDALAGESQDLDAVQLAAAITEAQRAFGALDCKAARVASTTAISIAAARQASGLPVPELPRAWTYLLLCADRAGDMDAAMLAAARLRVLGGSTDVPADVWRKYPELDTVAGRDLVALEITADVPGAAIWIDFQPAGTSPLKAVLPSGDHLIAAAAGSRRGWAAGTAVRTQTQLAIPTTEQRGPWSGVAQRVVSWGGKAPSPQELGWVMSKVRARLVLVRQGDRLEAWGRIGLAEPPHRIGGEDGIATLAEADRLIALVVDRVHTYNDRAPDPDQPLLLEEGHGDRRKSRDQPTRWWVYASIAGAVAAGAILIYANDAGTDKQRVELHQP